MRFAKSSPATLAPIVILIAPLAVGAWQAPAGDKPVAGAEAVPLATSSLASRGNMTKSNERSGARIILRAPVFGAEALLNLNYLI